MDLPESVPSPAFHCVGYFDDPHAGAERELLALARGLMQAGCAVSLWSVVPPHAWFEGQGVRGIQAFSGQAPRAGVLVWGGVHVPPALWLKYGKFERVIVQCNLAAWDRLFALIEVFRETTSLEPELVFVSSALQLSSGLPGRVVYSPMEIAPFLSVAAKRPALQQRPVTIGRVSRDTPGKHHPQDPLLYCMLAARGWRVRILGGTCLAGELAGVKGIELLAEGQQEVTAFYQTLDIFFYRTGTTVDAYGRVIAEAMASGLPVVAGSHGGYAEILAEGEHGVLVNSQEEAWDALQRLALDAPLRERMGQAAMRQAERLHGDAAMAAAIAAYRRGTTS